MSKTDIMQSKEHKDLITQENQTGKKPRKDLT